MEQPEDERAAFIAEECAQDHVLRDEVIGLLEEPASDEAFSEGPSIPDDIRRSAKRVPEP